MRLVDLPQSAFGCRRRRGWFRRRELLVTSPSTLPQRLLGGSQLPSAQLWVSFNRKPMRVAQFVTKHPIKVSDAFREELLSPSFTKNTLRGQQQFSAFHQALQKLELGRDLV